VFSPSIAGSVGKTVTKHRTKLRSGLNFPGFTFVGETVKIFFSHQQQIASNPNWVATICFHTGLESTGQRSTAWVRKTVESVYQSVFTGFGINVMFSYLSQTKSELGFDRNVECHLLSAPQWNLKDELLTAFSTKII